jgi:hypothetical protein
MLCVLGGIEGLGGGLFSRALLLTIVGDLRFRFFAKLP